MGVSKADWKLFQEKVPKWQEVYMERLDEEYIELLNSDEPASIRFWKLAERIKEDRKNPGVMLRLDKNETVYDIVRLIRYDVITIDDLDGFSEDIRETVQRMIDD